METKKQIRFFTIVEHEKEQEYLRTMHKKGWKLVRVSGLTVYHFEKCVPEDVVYQLDYNKEGLANKEEYVQMFRDCGWEYLQDYVGFSYFRKPASEMNGEEEIFSNAESKLQMMERVFKGRMIPLLVLFFCVLLPQFVIQIGQQNNGIAALLGGILGLYIVIFVTYAVKFTHYKNTP